MSISQTSCINHICAGVVFPYGCVCVRALAGVCVCNLVSYRSQKKSCLVNDCCMALNTNSSGIRGSHKILTSFNNYATSQLQCYTLALFAHRHLATTKLFIPKRSTCTNLTTSKILRYPTPLLTNIFKYIYVYMYIHWLTGPVTIA